MVKIVNKAKMPVRVDEIPIGECFMSEGKLFMRVRNNGGYSSVCLNSGVNQTNIHNDTRVQPVNVTIEVG